MAIIIIVVVFELQAGMLHSIEVGEVPLLVAIADQSWLEQQEAAIGQPVVVVQPQVASIVQVIMRG